MQKFLKNLSKTINNCTKIFFIAKSFIIMQTNPSNQPPSLKNPLIINGLAVNSRLINLSDKLAIYMIFLLLIAAHKFLLDLKLSLNSLNWLKLISFHGVFIHSRSSITFFTKISQKKLQFYCNMNFSIAEIIHVRFSHTFFD